MFEGGPDLLKIGGVVVDFVVANPLARAVHEDGRTGPVAIGFGVAAQILSKVERGIVAVANTDQQDVGV